MDQQITHQKEYSSPKSQFKPKYRREPRFKKENWEIKPYRSIERKTEFEKPKIRSAYNSYSPHRSNTNNYSSLTSPAHYKHRELQADDILKNLLNKICDSIESKNSLFKNIATSWNQADLDIRKIQNLIIQRGKEGLR